MDERRSISPKTLSLPRREPGTEASLKPFAIHDNPSPAINVSSGHVRLVLVHGYQFYLEIPLNIISSLCLKPRKYLVFLGWCILGVEGGLAESHDSGGMAVEGDLSDRGVYYYVTDGQTGKLSSRLSLLFCMRTNFPLANEDLSHAVDLDVIKERSNMHSNTTDTRDKFRDKLLKRDVLCLHRIW